MVLPAAVVDAGHHLVFTGERRRRTKRTLASARAWRVGAARGVARLKIKKTSDYIPEQACGGSGNINVVELLRLATAQPKDCGLKLRSCCIKSEHSIRATSAKCRSHSIWFCWGESTEKHSQRDG